MSVTSIFARWLMAVVLGSVTASASLRAQPQLPDGNPPTRDSSGSPPRDYGGPLSHDYGGPPRGPGGPSPFSRGYEMPTEATSKQGYVFINGEYLPPPYSIRLTDNVLTVNGKQVECIPPSRGFGGRGYGMRSAEQPSWRFMVGELQSQLHTDLAVLCFANQPYVVLDSSTTYDLLKSLTMQSGRAVRQAAVREKLPADFDKAVWDQWLERFQPSGELLQRAASLITNFEDAQREAEADMRATRWLNRLSYPLAVSGMVLSVLAVGHLLGGGRMPASAWPGWTNRPK